MQAGSSDSVGREQRACKYGNFCSRKTKTEFIQADRCESLTFMTFQRFKGGTPHTTSRNLAHHVSSCRNNSRKSAGKT